MPTYDLTDLDALLGLPMPITLVVRVWGMTLTAATAAVSVWIGKKLK